jgi:hypothetical protein
MSKHTADTRVEEIPLIANWDSSPGPYEFGFRIVTVLM